MHSFNKVLLERGFDHHLHIVYGCFQFVIETILLTKPKTFTTWILVEKVC